MGVLLAALFLAAPNTALADNECGLQTLPGMPETLTCAPGDYDGGTNPGPGITYTSDGDLTLQVTDDSENLDVFEAGIEVTGAGGDSVFWDSSAFINNDITGTGIVMNYASGTGAIGIQTGGDVLGLDDATHAIRAESTGGGAITIETNGSVSSDQYGIQAIGSGGAVTITTNGSVFGDEYGIQATNSGAGIVDITAAGAVDISGGTGVAAIDATTTGTGDVLIDVAAGSGTVHGRNGNAIRADSGSDVLVDIASGRTVRVNQGSTTALDLTAAGNITVNNDGSIAISNQGTSIRAVSDSFTLDNSGDIARGLDLNVAGASVINNTGAIDVRSGIGGTDGLHVSGGSLTLNNGGSIRGTFDFTGLEDGYVFNNNAGGSWRFGSASEDAGDAGNLSELGAGEINNAGTIDLGNGGRQVISARGATFTGTGDSLLIMSLRDPEQTAQTSCSAVTVADCLDLTGGATAGQTAIRFNGVIITDADNPLIAPFGVVNPGVLLVDVSGGVSADEHFVLDPGSTFLVREGGDQTVTMPYAEDPVYGAVLDTGLLFDYALLYNPDTQQHILASVPTRQGVEYAFFGHEALSVWHTTSDVVAGRQVDLRAGGERGGWMRVFNDSAERDAAPRLTTHGNTFVYDRSYDLNARGVIAGSDISVSDNHVFGAHLGFMATRLEHDQTSTVDETVFPSSVTFGVYGGWWNDAGLTLDGTVNMNGLDIEHGASDGQENSRTNVFTMGARLEAGWRMPFSEVLYVQPLLTAAYARADIENLDLRVYDMKFENAESQRAALGVRLGGGTDLTGERFSRVKYWLTARAWEEYAEDGRVEYDTGAEPLAIEDDISEGFEEVGLGVSLTSPDENLEVFLSGNVRSGDQTDGSNVTIGARLNW